VDVTWEAVGPRLVRLRWKESGGPPVKGPVTPSLGTELVKAFAQGELRGVCELRFPEGGADHVLEFPRE
jgi:two-component sensor histidine kinase